MPNNSRRKPLPCGLVAACLLAYGAFAAEPGSYLYADPQPVQITGYTGSVMEVFLSPDGKHLSFNNSNDHGVNTDLQGAIRTGPNSFRYTGPLTILNSSKLDAAPSMDRAGDLYFTSMRSYDSDRQSLYRSGDLGTVKPVAVEGTITPARGGTGTLTQTRLPCRRSWLPSQASSKRPHSRLTKKELFFHKRTGNIFTVWRAMRTQ